MAALHILKELVLCCDTIPTYPFPLTTLTYHVPSFASFLAQAPHSMIADAHRQSVDVVAWHPSGHMVATASHDCILKFWCREPPGSECCDALLWLVV